MFVHWSINGYGRTIRFRTRGHWRIRLEANHDKKREVWVVFQKEGPGRPSYRIAYNEALQEALCFGRIDSRVRSIDRLKCAVRFSP
jgi:uncharacterized protein YdeI (YjbR/CyaY-like superfamily)